MTKAQYNLALNLARSSAPLEGKYSDADSQAMIGFGCADFAGACVPIAAVAGMIRYQCQLFSGGWDYENENNDRKYYLRSKLTVLDAVAAAKAVLAEAEKV